MKSRRAAGKQASPSAEAQTAPTGSASPATPAPGRLFVTGEVTDIDYAKGIMAVKTPSGDVNMTFPPTTARTIQKGDRVQIDVSRRATR